nr:FadR/GntR family transcriptional regulator [uncultured Cohaesibacter sp.]
MNLLNPKTPLSESVSTTILEFIRKHQLKPGDSLPSESEIGDMAGASRTVVREALRSLEARRIIDMAAGKKACVAILDNHALANFIMNGVATKQINVPQIHDVRRTVETRIAHLAALLRTSAQAQTISDHAKVMCDNINKPEIVMTHDMAFHQELAQATQNPVYSIVMGSLSEVLTMTWPITWRCRTCDEERLASVKVHMEIADAIKQGDPELSVRMITKHFDEDLKPLALSGMV